MVETSRFEIGLDETVIYQEGKLEYLSYERMVLLERQLVEYDDKYFTLRHPEVNN